MEHLIEAPQELPVIGEYDVMVLGGGPAGISAAISASRTGAKTAIIERYGYLGGQATGGLVIYIVGRSDGKEVIIKGNCEELIGRLKELNATKERGLNVLFDPESMKYVCDCFIEENNITPYYHSYISNVLSFGNWISGVLIDGKSGRSVIRAKSFVDATGDADLAKYANVPFEQENTPNLMPVTLGFRAGGIDVQKVSAFILKNNEKYLDILRNFDITTGIGGWIYTTHPDEIWFNIAHIQNINPTKNEDLTKAEIICRNNIHKLVEAFKMIIPGFENGYIVDTAQQIGIRESRRIIGIHKFTKEDITKKFDDAIAKAPNYSGIGEGSVEIPYRCLISKHVGNLIFAGRCISIEHDLLDMVREIPCCMATGQAAGIAAALAAQNSKDPGNLHKVDIDRLREILLQQGTLL